MKEDYLFYEFFQNKYNDCMVEIYVDDKEPPVCYAPEDVSVFCDGVPYGHNTGLGSLKKRYCIGGSSAEAYEPHEPHNVYHVCPDGEVVTYPTSSSHSPYSTGCTLYVEEGDPYDIKTRSPDLDCQEGYYGGPGLRFVRR